MSDKHRYVVMRKSGAVMMFSGCPDTTGPILSIFDAIERDGGQSGRDYDEPTKLFRDGELVVESGLWSMASNYTLDRDTARTAADRAVQNIHIPKWAMDERPGFNPPGVDRWIVRPAKEEQ